MPETGKNIGRKKKKYVMARISGGLGNQMFAYATMMKIAAATGRTVLVDSSEYSLVRDRKFSLADFAGPSHSASAPLAFRILSRVSCVMEHFGFAKSSALLLGIFGWRRFGFDITLPPEADAAEFDSAIACRNRVVYLTGCCQRLQSIAGRQLLLEAFAPVAAQNAFNPRGEAVSIHVRRGDYLSVRGGSMSLGRNYYKKAIEFVRSKVERPVWYVFSDDIEWCRKAFSDLGGAVFVDGDTDHPARDMLSMAQCRHHIIANSTFSWWGAYLSRTVGTVVYPEEWMPGIRASRAGIVPPEWTAIDKD